MRRQAIIAALLIVSVGVVLGATVFRADIAQATGLAGRAQYVDGCITGSLRSKVIRFRASDGVPLHGVLLGSGRNGIVLSHALQAGTLCDWFPFVPQLAVRGYRVLAYDSRPLSGPPPRPFGTGSSPLHFARDVLGAERVLVAHGATRVIVGGDFDGGTAAMTAAAHIPRSTLAGVVMLSSPRQFGGMNAEAAARRVKAPSFFGAGSRGPGIVDEIRKLYAASASKQKQLVVTPSSGYGTQLLDPNWAPASFRTKLLAFIASAFRR
jgi:pimeloyl-ACP methyl ester carboxylesterase